MKIPRPPHNWSVSPTQAIAIQKKLAPAVKQKALSRRFRFLAGVDAAFSSDGRFCLAAVVLWDRQTGEAVESHTARRRLIFPYIPGLLSFREAPTIIDALRKLQKIPDCLICDGQGIAHPRRCGIASHIGLLVKITAIGCAKSRLVGDFRMPAARRSSRSPLSFNDEVIGAVLRTRDRVQPVFVSVGHLIDLDRAVEVILDCSRGFRLPEPTRLADQLVGREKKRGLSVQKILR